MIYNDDRDVLVDFFFDDHLVGLGILLKFFDESFENPEISTHQTLEPSKSDTTRYFRLI